MNLKLNLNFDLYKGTTRLKQWYKEVKAHFTQVQEAHNALDTTVSTHKTAAIIDHPDESVTTEKIADESITLRKLSLDILKEITKIPEFLYYEAEPVYLSGCKESLGYELPADIPVNVLFILENDTDSSLSEFRTHDDYYTPLSCKIPSGETRICILLKRASGGADPQNGYLFVLDDTDTKSLINKETLERKNTDTTLQQNIDTEAVNRQTADNALDGRVKTVEEKAHTHENKTVLDSITVSDVAGWNDITALQQETEEHITQTPDTDGGVHGVRAADGKIEIFDGRNFVEMQKAYKTYGVSIDLTNSDPEAAVTYTDDAVGMVAGSSDWDNTNIFRDIRPCLFRNGMVVGYLDPDDFSKFADGTDADITSGDAGDVMIEIPKTGVKITTSGNTLTVQITDNPNAEGFSYLAHTRENEGDRNKVYIGAFLASNVSSKLRSLSGKTPIETSLTEMRTLAQANGSGYEQIAFYQLTLLQCLFLIKYKNRDSQTALGRGLVDANGYLPTGGTLTKGMDYGETTGTKQMKFLGIEDFWGNYWQWLDGLVSSSDYHALTATTNFNDDGTGYKDLGKLFNSHTYGYMKTPQGTNDLGFIVKSSGGSSTTYFADYSDFDGGCVACFGGIYAYGSSAGAFYLIVSGFPGDEYGGRLMYL